MKLKETYISFTNEGRYAYFIVLDDNGAFKDVDELLKTAVHFPRIVITGDEPFKDKDEVAKLVTKATKLNPRIVFEINTDGSIQPVKIGNYRNVEYHVRLKMKDSKIAYDKRVNSKVILYFSEAASKFIFDIKNENDMDEANMIIRDNVIKKHQVFFRFVGHPTEDELAEIINKSKSNGYNFMIQWKDIFWPEVGKHE